MIEDKDLLKKLEELVNRDEATFTEEEVKTVKKMVKVYSAFEVLGSLGSLIKTTLLWFATIIGVYVTAKSGLITWLSTLK